MGQNVTCSRTAPPLGPSRSSLLSEDWDNLLTKCHVCMTLCKTCFRRQRWNTTIKQERSFHVTLGPQILTIPTGSQAAPGHFFPPHVVYDVYHCIILSNCDANQWLSVIFHLSLCIAKNNTMRKQAVYLQFPANIKDAGLRCWCNYWFLKVIITEK